MLGNLANTVFAFRNKIGFKFAIFTWIILVATIVIFFFLNLESFKKIVLERLRSEATNIATSTIESNSVSLITEEYSYLVEHCVNLVKASSSLDYIVIVKKDGFSIIHTKNGWKTDTLGGFWFSQTNPNEENIIKSDLTGNNVYHYSTNFVYSGINWGWIHIGLNLKDYNESLTNYYNTTFLISIFLTVLGLFVSIMFARQFSKPIRVLEQSAQKIAQGDLDVKVKLKSHDEIASLANSFNQMAKSVKFSRDELEQKVKQRTLELANRNESLRLEIKFRKQIEEDLREAKLVAEQSERMKSDFLAQMSHEIRTPVNTILSFTSLLKAEFENKIENADLKDSFNIIENGSKRLTRTIDLILNMSALQAGTYKPQYERWNLSRDILSPLLSEMKVIANSNGLKLLFEDNGADSEISVDQYSTTQIFANLIHNSIKYTPEGIITVRTELIDKRLLVSITDTGIGIDEKFLPHLFNAFTQEENGYTRKFEGTGLGMALVKEYCKINNADISVKSKKGLGTTFTVTFPLSIRFEGYSQ